jgi:hypothetical protein
MGIPPKVVVPVPDTEGEMPDSLRHDAATSTLYVGSGEVRGVSTAMRAYDVSGVNVLDKWFSYRKKTRERPVIGDKQRSDLEGIHARSWKHSYTVELLDLLNVLGLLIELEPAQSQLLEAILAGPMVTVDDLVSAGALPVEDEARRPAVTGGPRMGMGEDQLPL